MCVSGGCCGVCVGMQAVQKYEETIDKIKATPGAKVLCGGKRLQGTKVHHTIQTNHTPSSLVLIL